MASTVRVGHVDYWVLRKRKVASLANRGSVAAHSGTRGKRSFALPSAAGMYTKPGREAPDGDHVMPYLLESEDSGIAFNDAKQVPVRPPSTLVTRALTVALPTGRLQIRNGETIYGGAGAGPTYHSSQPA
ncbi:hypothetical protein M8818_005130 [Zalaria obscura]|uniref:Uncharacterized protein n=1 Tax=Zalaria obscura TaxID=2024903 RepID=A0ACC3SBM7_9PEZI